MSANNKPFTQEQIEWVKQQYQDDFLTCEEIAKKFTKKFHRLVNEDAIKGIKYRHLKNIPVKKYYKFVTEESAKTIEKYYHTNTYDEIKQKVLEINKLNLSIDTIKNYCHKKFGTNKNNRTTFKKGSAGHKKYGVGAEVVRGVYIYVKTAEPCVWEMKQKVIYEQHFGKIKENEIVLFLDGNPRNFNLDNLQAVDRGVLADLNHKHYANKGQFTKTAINYYELLKTL